MLLSLCALSGALATTRSKMVIVLLTIIACVLRPIEHFDGPFLLPCNTEMRTIHHAS
jgi:hypothetical protein